MLLFYLREHFFLHPSAMFFNLVNKHFAAMDMEISNETKQKEHHTNQNSSSRGQPHEALYLVLPYLPLFELLAMAGVCRSFKDALDSDILPWLNIVVDEKLQKSRVSDQILMKIASKAMGRLRSLVLINCVKITDDGFQDVIAKNPYINKLHIPRCTGLTPTGIIRAVTTLNQHHPTVTSLEINGIFNITKEHLQTLRSLIKLDQMPESSRQEQADSGSSIDVGICPKCDEVRMVFDCSLETCGRKRAAMGCQGCKFCVPRCEECGKCVGFDDEDENEAACEDTLCAGCWIQLPKCSFCNRPYCNEHAYKQCVLPGSSGFVCDVCYSKIDKI